MQLSRRNSTWTTVSTEGYGSMHSCHVQPSSAVHTDDVTSTLSFESNISTKATRTSPWIEPQTNCSSRFFLFFIHTAFNYNFWFFLFFFYFFIDGLAYLMMALDMLLNLNSFINLQTHTSKTIQDFLATMNNNFQVKN